MLPHDKQKIAYAKMKDKSLCKVIMDMYCNNRTTENIWSEIMIPQNQLLLSKMKDVNGNFTLHSACKKCAPEHVIDILLAKNKNAAATKSDNKQYPLNIALTWHLPEMVVLKIFRAFPEAAKHQYPCSNFHRGVIPGWYPLHLACSVGKYSETLITKLIEAFPEAARYKDSVGTFPLHIACTHNARLSIIKALVSYYPDALLQQCVDVSGQKFLPVELAMNKKNQENVEFLRDATVNHGQGGKDCSISGNCTIVEESEDKDFDDCVHGKMKRQKH